MNETDKLSKIEIYKEMHYHEVNRKNELNERTKWLLSMWILVLGTIIFCFQNYYKVEPNLKVVFDLFILYSITFVLLSGVLLGITFSKKPYAHLPSPKIIEKYLTENPSESFEDLTIEIFSNAYDHNFKKNNKLLERLVDCTHVMMAAVILLFFCFLCLVPNWIEKEEPVQKIEIIEGGAINE